MKRHIKRHIKKSVYVLIPLFCFAGPFAMSFDRKVNFIQYLFPTILAILIVGLLYIFWDTIVTRNGHWQFNDEYVGKFRVLHLPIGEWLFFLLIPYSCLFIFEVVAAYWGEGTPRPDLLWLHYALSGLFMFLALVCRKKGYTFLAMASVSIFFLAAALFTPGALFASGYLISFLFVFIAFLLVDGLYTSIPTITYNEGEIFGIRIARIPLEDFLYNLSYIGLLFTTYITLKRIL